ncbi:ATP-dependent DNA helicase PIF1-like protein [Tanacetum coccineum]|uniref:ATP-dependent DNA helicase n=1 Tax=Tanacetum coccineum TaxID=301880 RepID=A0ABQ5FHR6_9ASTR
MVLKAIKRFLQSMGKDLDDFDLPKLNIDASLESRVVWKLQEEYSIVVEEEHLVAFDSLNSDHRDAYDEILRHVDNDISGMFFIDGPGGTRKMFLYKAFLAKVRSRGLIALVTTSSGAAANNMPGGRTAHSRFKIPINLENNSLCNIKKQSRTAKLLRATKLIIWDEALIAKRQAVEALDRSMQDITGMRLPFGGKIMGLGDPWFSDFLLRVGNEDEEVVDKNYIRIPDEMTIPYNDMARSKEELINAIFPSFQVFLPRIPLSPSESDMFPFKLKRKQFLVRLSFAMTINKAQGQTILNVGAYLLELIFSHGQLYIAFSRGISRHTTKVFVNPTKKFNVDGVYTSNVVYR